MTKFHLIDYSEVCYKMLGQKDIPKNRGGKFVQICDNAKEFIILSPRELSVYHANIVERFCALRDIKGAFNKKHDHFKVFDLDWNIIGGGMWKINEIDKIIRFFGVSKAYGGFYSMGLKEKINAEARMLDYKVIVN